ncbi:MAG TPA: methylmalonyl-CoA mutase family protein [Xanthobacteraceae bacterium]|jgi:methylmalonyl-CoA mutase|nr:methylmalonyl-CoA mutase family protein [Xanthobacteraceae bacterium]
MSDDLTLGAEFPAATRERWLKLVDGVLKGAPFDKKLVSRTYDGLRIEPLYERAASAVPVAGRTPGVAWTLLQRVDHPDPAVANAQALEDLENGANGLTLVFAGSVSANGYGLDPSPATLARALDGVRLETGITIDFNLSPPTRDAVRHFAGLVKGRGLSPASVNMRASINPIGGFAASGASPRPWAALAQGFAAMVRELAEQGFGGPFAVADGRIIHNAGGSEAQELAFAIASAVEYLRALTATGMPLDAARRMVYFRLSADADQFLTMAKFRALRKLWARVEEACGVAPKAVYVAAETAWRMMTKRDPNVNMLRLTMAVAAAGLGGADSITALPHTAALGLPDAFARRIARNTQLILLEESNLAKVADPAAGSGAIEDITAKMCAAAWSLFQEIEAAGGAWAALEQGLIQGKVAAVRAQRLQAVAHRTDALTGTSDFPDLHESPPAVLDVAEIVAPKEAAVAVTIEPLRRIRLAEPFERLREASDRILAQRGARPKVFLANLGNLSDFTARATFAKNFFEAGGIEAVTNDGFASHDAMAAAFKASGAKLACLCGSDEVYAKEAIEAAKALAVASHVYLAGRPRELESRLKAAGVGTFVFAGCDALATLSAAHDILGVGA